MTRKAFIDLTLGELVMIVLAIALIIVVLMVGSKTLGIFMGGGEERATLTSAESLAILIQRLINDPREYSALQYAPIFIANRYTVVGYNAKENPDYRTSYFKYKPSRCGESACICVFSAEDAIQRHDNEEERRAQKEDGLKACYLLKGNAVIKRIEPGQQLWRFEGPDDGIHAYSDMTLSKHLSHVVPIVFYENAIETTLVLEKETAALYVDKYEKDGTTYVSVGIQGDNAVKRYDKLVHLVISRIMADGDIAAAAGRLDEASVIYNNLPAQYAADLKDFEKEDLRAKLERLENARTIENLKHSREEGVDKAEAAYAIAQNAKAKNDLLMAELARTSAFICETRNDIKSCLAAANDAKLYYLSATAREGKQEYMRREDRIEAASIISSICRTNPAVCSDEKFRSEWDRTVGYRTSEDVVQTTSRYYQQAELAVEADSLRDHLNAIIALLPKELRKPLLYYLALLHYTEPSKKYPASETQPKPYHLAVETAARIITEYPDPLLTVDQKQDDRFIQDTLDIRAFARSICTNMELTLIPAASESCAKLMPLLAESQQ